MELKDRIALARKQAGLSQEQLGEKLGVSRQAVSKWESGQNNPDVAYLAEMCRLFGVSSDWLLLGQETEEASTPARCPDCQTIVTGLDNFCPNCGCSLKSSPKEQYALVLKSILSSPEDNSVLYHICDEGVYRPAFSPGLYSPHSRQCTQGAVPRSDPGSGQSNPRPLLPPKEFAGLL